MLALLLLAGTPVAALPAAAEPSGPTSSSAPFETMKVLVLDFRADGAAPSTTRVVRDEIAIDLGHDKRFEVLTSEDLRRTVSVESDREQAGCTSESCLAELGAAMGARYIVHGSVGVLGSSTVVQLNLFDTKAAKAIDRESAEALSKEALLDALHGAVARLRAHIGGEPEGPSPLFVTGLVGAGVGGTALVASLLGVAVTLPTVKNTTPPASGGPSGNDRGTAQVVGALSTVAAGVSGAVLAGSVAVLAAGLAE